MAGASLSSQLRKGPAGGPAIPLCYDLPVLRNVGYRTAINLFVFSGLWLIIGALALWSPLPSALGILSGFFAAWVLLFFVVLALAGAALTVAALNAAFPPASPPTPGAPPRAASAPAKRTTTPAPRNGATHRTRRPGTSAGGDSGRGSSGTLWAPPSRYDG